jgi:NAD(P)-dependent dehydrogenase (short-subunit alcohol dehydrogenase family)
MKSLYTFLLMPDIQTIDPAWRPAADLLRERVILITGAADGIGRALATGCGAHGATTVLLDRNIRGLESLYDASVAAGYPEPALYPMDLETAAPGDYQTLYEVLDREFGRLDGLVHNAALLGALTPLAHFDDELWYRVMQTNLNAPYQLTRACLELLTRPADASILFSSDTTGRRGKAYWGAYGVSKAGIENLMQVLADELATNTGIRVNSIDPGAVRTALRTIAYPAEDRSTLRAPKDVIGPFLYLLGPGSRGISGRQYVVA